MPSTKPKAKILELKIEELGEKYASFRFVDPKTEEKVKDSVKRNGQLTPLTVSREGGIFQLVDGFKRVRACRELEGFQVLEARVVEGDHTAGKVTMLRMNMDRKGMCPLEEGLLLRAMHRGDGLDQVQIAILVNRHKSWVCRRIALAERLSDHVVEHMRLGLISASQGRALTKLPRGNQDEVLSQMETHALSSRECEKLVNALAGLDPINTRVIEAVTENVLSQRFGKEENPPKKGSGEKKAGMWALLLNMTRRCLDVVELVETQEVDGTVSMVFRQKVDEAIDAAGLAARQLRHHYRGEDNGQS
jgi:ParB-like chromosome segregation protein Spo0J